MLETGRDMALRANSGTMAWSSSRGRRGAFAAPSKTRPENYAYTSIFIRMMPCS